MPATLHTSVPESQKQVWASEISHIYWMLRLRDFSHNASTQVQVPHILAGFRVVGCIRKSSSIASKEENTRIEGTNKIKSIFVRTTFSMSNALYKSPCVRDSTRKVISRMITETPPKPRQGQAQMQNQTSTYPIELT